jgi:hypothetical protein
MTEILLGSVHKQILDKEYKEYRKYFVVMKRILLIKDQHQDYRINYSMNQLLVLMNKQTQYFFETDISQQYIIRVNIIVKPIDACQESSTCQMDVVPFFQMVLVHG